MSNMEKFLSFSFWQIFAKFSSFTHIYKLLF
jgi:hypothetical protein